MPNIFSKNSHFLQKPNRRKEVRVAVILFITVLCFAVCWLPIHVLNAISR